MHNISNLYYFGKNTLHVLDGLSICHQESKTVHTASDICHTGSVAASKQPLMTDGETVRNMYSVVTKIK